MIKIGDSMKNKRGFTLVELTAVVILLALISVLGYSYITKSINSKKEDISEAMNKIINEAASIYMGYNPTNYKKIDGNVYCIKLSELTDLELLSNPIIDPITSKTISLDKYIKVEVNVDEYIYNTVDLCTEKR